jgi:hypothetical protein
MELCPLLDRGLELVLAQASVLRRDLVVQGDGRRGKECPSCQYLKLYLLYGNKIPFDINHLSI